MLDDETLLTEGAAIVQYVADLVPAKKLAPPNGTIERVKLQAWLNFFASEIHKGGFSPLFYKGVPEEGRDVFRTRLKARFSHLDRHLALNEYLMGRNYSVADAHFFVLSNWASWVNFDLSPYRAVLAYRQRIGSRPARNGAKGHFRTHARQQFAVYSITSSARASSVGGTVRPSALAVLRLTTSSNLVGCWIGKLPAFSPRRMRSTYVAAFLCTSAWSAP